MICTTYYELYFDYVVHVIYNTVLPYYTSTDTHLTTAVIAAKKKTKNTALVNSVFLEINLEHLEKRSPFLQLKKSCFGAVLVMY